MKLSVFAVLLAAKPFDEACKYLANAGVQAVEIGCGGFPGKAHCDPKEFLAHPEKIDEMLATLKKYNLEIAALSTHGNCVHPNPEVARQFEEDYENTILLAEKMGVDTVVTFSGCPGGSPEDKTPNWVTCPWPDDYSRGRGRYHWREFRSQPPVLAGHRSRGGHPRAGRGDLFLPRQGYQGGRTEHRRERRARYQALWR